MPEIASDPSSLSCSHLFPEPGIQVSQALAPDPFPPRARDARGRFAKGSSGNPPGRPRGIRNPRRRVPDLLARPLSPKALSDLIDRKPHLLRPLAEQALPRPASIGPAERLGVTSTPAVRPRIAGWCSAPFWRRLRGASSRPPRARASHAACGRGCGPSGASLNDVRRGAHGPTSCVIP